MVIVTGIIASEGGWRHTVAEIASFSRKARVEGKASSMWPNQSMNLHKDWPLCEASGFDMWS